MAGPVVGRSLKALVCAALTVLSLIAPASATEGEATTTVRVQLKWFHAFQFAGFYAAQQQGYFKEAGLEVALLEGGPTIDPVDSVTRGDADFGIGNSSLLIDFNKGRPVKAIAAIFQHSPYVILARREPGLNTVQDLAGRTLMGETHAAELHAYLKLADVDISRINIVPHTGTVRSLLPDDPSGIDATTAYTTAEPYFAAELNLPYQIFNPRDIGIDFYGDTLFTSTEFANSQPDVVIAMRDALIKGWTYAHANQDEIIQYIEKTYLGPDQHLALVFEANATDPLLDAHYVDIGYMSHDRWRRIGDTFVQANELPEDYILEGFLFEDASMLPPWVSQLLAGTTTTLFLAIVISAYIIRQNRKLAISLGLLAERTRSLEKANIELDDYRNHLEMRVAESTADLKSTIARLEETEYAMNFAGIGIQWVDFDTGRITHVNTRMAEMLGYTRQELQSLSVQDINDDYDPHGHSNQREIIKQEGRLQLETSRRAKSGRVIPVEVLAYYKESNERQTPHVIAFVTDITSRKQAEEELNRLVAERTFELAEANRELEKLSITDGLTGLTNRRRFDEALAAECSRAQRANASLALAMIDIDHFKQFNDHYGHQRGDECLKNFANVLMQLTRRAGDLSARYGGEEFALIFTNTGRKEARLLAEEVCKAIEALAMPHEASPFRIVTASIGVAILDPGSTYPPQDLIAHADAALYQAKRNGRNRFEISNAEPRS